VVALSEGRTLSQQLNKSMTELAQNDIQRVLPHRFPFLFVDRITEFVPGQRIVAVKHFSVNDEALRGNVPGLALVPMGVVMELVTQVGAVLVLERPEMAGKIAMILQISSARLLKPVEAGDTVRVEAEVLKMKSLFGELRGAIFRGSDLVADGQMRFGIANAADVLLAAK